MKEQQAIKFSCIQVSELLEVMEKHGVEANINSDAHASKMFSELTVKALRKLDADQVNDLWDAV